MTDLHSHILPGIDDGSPDIDTSLEMAKLAVSSGTRRLCATPHAGPGSFSDNSRLYEIRENFSYLKQELFNFGIKLDLSLGMEILATEDMGAGIKDGTLIPINGSRYFLTEFFFDEEPLRIRHFIDIVFSAGGVPLIAHPERYFCVQDNPALVYEWLRMGCLSQINKSSLFGSFGPDARCAAEVLLHNSLATCIASDSHGTQRRTPDLSPAREYLTKNFDEDTARLLLEENPERILFNRTINPHGRRPGRDFSM